MSDLTGSTADVGRRYFRLAGVVAIVYAGIDFAIIGFGSALLPLRLIGVAAALFVIMDMIELREAGVEWGWTRYLVLIGVAVLGFLGFIIYAYRRMSKLQAIKAADAESKEEVDAESGKAVDADSADPTEADSG